MNIIAQLEFEVVKVTDKFLPFYFINLSYKYRAIGLMSRVFANGPGDRGSIPGRVIPKTQKLVFDAAFLNTQDYNVRIKGKVEQSRERSSALLYFKIY